MAGLLWLAWVLMLTHAHGTACYQTSSAARCVRKPEGSAAVLYARLERS